MLIDAAGKIDGIIDVADDEREGEGGVRGQTRISHCLTPTQQVMSYRLKDAEIKRFWGLRFFVR